MIPSYIIWDFNPTFFSIGSFEVRWYGVTWALAFAVGLWLFSLFVKREKLPEKIIDSIFWFGVLSTVIGSRLGHCLFYEQEYFMSHPWEILNFRGGGMASHGAAIGLLVGLWLFSRKNKLPYLWSLDRIMLAVTIGGAFVRFGNLFNSEIYGVETTMPWGFIFVRAGETVPKHPTQIYEALSYLLIFAVLCVLYFRTNVSKKHPGFMFGLSVSLLFLARFLIEYVKNPQIEAELHMSLFIGQWLSIPFILGGLAIMLWSVSKNNRPLSLEDARKVSPKRKNR